MISCIFVIEGVLSQSEQNHLTTLQVKRINMKHILLFLFLISGSYLSAQTEITDAIFPEAGDTLFTAVDNLPSSTIEITAAGGDQSWDFTALQAPFTRQTLVLDASEGDFSASFPNTNLVYKSGLNAETYYSVSDDEILLVGFTGADPVGIGVELVTKFDPAYTSQRAPLNFFDVNQFESNLNIPFATDEIPGGIFDNLPITPDSIRIRIAIDRLDVVDAWGNLTIPGGIYDVLREKRTEVRDTRLDAKVGFFGWQDVTDIILAAAGEFGDIAEQLGTDTILSYHFISDEAKEPIAVATMSDDEESILQVEYKANDVVTNVQDVTKLKPGVYVSPNPAMANVRFEFSNLESGIYTLRIYNILGVEVWSQKYQINGTRTEKVNISSLRKGTYLYSLISPEGKTLTTKRLIVVRP